MPALLWPVEQMPGYLQWLARFLPLKYGIDGLRGIMLFGEELAEVWFELVVLVGFAVVTSVLAAITLRRRVGA